MKAFILFTAIAFFSCSDILEPDPFKGIPNNQFHFKLDGQDNRIDFTALDQNSQLIVENWDMKKNIPANKILSVYFAPVGREGVRTELEFFSSSYIIESVELVEYNFPSFATKTDSSLIVNFPDIFEVTDFDCDMNFMVYFSYPD